MKENISSSDYNLFIDNNALRYMEIFSQDAEKKVFLSTNWAAFFFTAPWLFYRKMYKIGVAMFAVLLILTVGSFAASFSIAEDLKEKVDSEFSDYEKFEFLENQEIRENLTENEINDLLLRYDERELKKTSIGFWSWMIPMIIFVVTKLIFSLFADCIYRGHIRRNIERDEGGVSPSAVAFCIGAYGVFVFLTVFIISII